MSLIVETGACVPNANSFATLAEADAYFADFGGAWAGDDASKESALLRASAWLSTYPNWDGRLKCGRGNQGLAWPRNGVVDCEGETVPDNEVPAEVKIATYAAALVELTAAGSLTPGVTPGQQVKSEKVDVIEVQYMTPKDQGVIDGRSNTVASLRPMLTQVQDVLRCMASFPSGAKTPWPFVA